MPIWGLLEDVVLAYAGRAKGRDAPRRLHVRRREGGLVALRNRCPECAPEALEEVLVEPALRRQPAQGEALGASPDDALDGQQRKPPLLARPPQLLEPDAVARQALEQ